MGNLKNVLKIQQWSEKDNGRDCCIKKQLDIQQNKQKKDCCVPHWGKCMRLIASGECIAFKCHVSVSETKKFFVFNKKIVFKKLFKKMYGKDSATTKATK